jgi:hypothetical protein
VSHSELWRTLRIVWIRDVRVFRSRVMEVGMEMEVEWCLCVVSVDIGFARDMGWVAWDMLLGWGTRVFRRDCPFLFKTGTAQTHDEAVTSIICRRPFFGKTPVMAIPRDLNGLPPSSSRRTEKEWMSEHRTVLRSVCQVINAHGETHPIENTRPSNSGWLFLQIARDSSFPVLAFFSLLLGAFQVWSTPDLSWKGVTRVSHARRRYQKW